MRPNQRQRHPQAPPHHEPAFRILDSVVYRPEPRTQQNYIEVQAKVMYRGESSENTTIMTMSISAAHSLYNQLREQAGLVTGRD